MQNIKVLVSLISKNMGGMENSFLDYIKLLKQNSYNVVALVRKDFPDIDTLSKYADNIYTVEPRGYYDLISIYKTRRILKHINPKLIIAHGNRSISLLRKSSRGIIPIIAINHSNNVKRSIGSDIIVTVNNVMRENAIHKGQPPSRCEVIPNMVQLDQLSFNEEKQFSSTPVIGAIGRFSEEKGFRSFIYSLSILSQRNINFQAVIAGDGPLKKSLIDLVYIHSLEDKIKFIGWVDGEEKQEFYNSIDMLCVPSRSETFGIVILESAINSVPVISTPTDGALSIIENEKNGIISENTSPSAIAESLEKAIKNEKDMKLYAKRNFKFMQNNYSYHEVGKKIDKIINKVISI